MPVVKGGNMNIKKMLKVIFLSVFCLDTTSAANRYQTEIDVIKNNQAIYSEVAEKKMKAIDDVINVWRKIKTESSELQRIINLRVKTNTENQNESAKQLQGFSDEKIYVENALLAISTIGPKIEYLGKELEIQLSKIPEIKDDNLKSLASIVSNIHDLEDDFNKRKSKVDENLEVHRQWQFEIAAEAAATYKYAVMGNLEVIKSLGQIKNTLSLLSLKFSLVMKHKNESEAQKILNAYSWLKSAFPFYFSDKITTQSQYDLFHQIISDSEFEQHEMIESLSNSRMVKYEK